jgi:hypothetical protein
MKYKLPQDEKGIQETNCPIFNSNNDFHYGNFT